MSPIVASLKDQLLDLSKVEGITSVVVVSRDGFVIDGVSSSGDVDMDAVGAVLSAGIGSSEVMGRELNVGAMTQVMNEYKNGIIVANFLGHGAILVIVADLTANLGNIRYQLKKRSAGIEAVL
jgi:predicted regulator of Ras-like GTPase activity (Roadblock/LC7/MglB family)